jgi:hypothetical protein
MKHDLIIKFIILTFLLAFLSYSSNYKAATDLDVGLGMGNSIYFPVYSLSIGWISDQKYHDINTEFCADSLFSRKFIEFGLSYSYLLNFYRKNLYLGPSVSIVSVIVDQTTDTTWNTHPDDFTGAYFLGAKGVYLIGKSNLKLKISDRLLLGYRDKGLGNSSYRWSIFNVLCFGVFLVF